MTNVKKSSNRIFTKSATTEEETNEEPNVHLKQKEGHGQGILTEGIGSVQLTSYLR
jgi:hypothetical protein